MCNVLTNRDYVFQAVSDNDIDIAGFNFDNFVTQTRPANSKTKLMTSHLESVNGVHESPSSTVAESPLQTTTKMERQPNGPRPRLCHLHAWPDYDGYGFSLCARKGFSGQFIYRVELGSPADLGGLRNGDRIIEVNGTNVSSENHKQVSYRQTLLK